MFKLIKLPKIFYALSLLIVALLVLMQVKPRADSQAVHIVEFTIAGFVPDELTIALGDTVKFVNKTDKTFWPASDPHPIHTDYPGFDSRTAIASNESWSFRFEKTGEWAYHDHLSLLRGKIIIIQEQTLSRSQNLENCKDIAEQDKRKCWDKQIKLALDEGGIDAAWSAFEQLYKDGETVGCHWTSHLIGEAVAKQFAAGKQVKVGRSTSYCGYGFYHGFMETLLRNNPDTKQALAFCEDVNKRLGNLAQDNCFHGIGHGFTEDLPDPKMWGDANAMMKKGLDMCEYLFGKTVNKWEICATGVYTVVAKFMSKGIYGLSLEPNDPLSFCRTQPKKYNNACYGEFGTKLDKLANWDISKAERFVKGLDEKTANYVIKVANAAMLQRDVFLPDHVVYEQNCHKLFLNFQKFCIEGVVMGLTLHGEPGTEYKKIVAFCQLSSFSQSERDGCFGEAFVQFNRIYTSDKLKEVCETAKINYKDFCKYGT